MKKLKRLKLDGKHSLHQLAGEMSVLSKAEREALIGGGTAVITVQRLASMGDTTLSMFTVISSDYGRVCQGYFLEPVLNPDLAQTPGSDTAISAGTYGVVPSTYHGQYGYWEVTGVPGRSYIKIHPGNYGSNTEGCLLPGSSYSIVNGAFVVNNSRACFYQLSDCLNNYGSDGISMIINNPHY